LIIEVLRKRKEIGDVEVAEQVRLVAVDYIRYQKEQRIRVLAPIKEDAQDDSIPEISETSLQNIPVVECQN
jgi:hypothetical protein